MAGGAGVWRAAGDGEGLAEGAGSSGHLQVAVRNLRAINIVGTVERYNEWLGLAQSVLPDSFRKLLFSATRQNATNTVTETPHPSVLDDLVRDLGPEVAERLLRCNYLDMCLYQFADRLLTKRLAEERGTSRYLTLKRRRPAALYL